VLALKIFNRLLSTGSIDSTSRLLIVGMSGPETGRIYRHIREASLTQRVELVSGISDEEMQWCYRHCELLLAPSIVEGFGLPVAEGLLAGCRVICSDIPPFREVGGDHCRYVPLGPDAEMEFARAACDALREHRRSPQTLSQLSTHVIGEKYMLLYRNAISSAISTGSVLVPVRGAAENRPILGKPKSASPADERSAARLW
jgi:glycosyltransferase involved in cell wall biosynthesis